MGKALEGVHILDFTHAQSGPTCTQLLAWFGADVIKVERPGTGDITRGQLRDIPNVDSLYFTMLNHNKRSITLDTKNPKGKEVLGASFETQPSAAPQDEGAGWEKPPGAGPVPHAAGPRIAQIARKSWTVSAFRVATTATRTAAAAPLPSGS
jgi:CoA-transferase family III